MLDISRFGEHKLINNYRSWIVYSEVFLQVDYASSLSALLFPGATKAL